MSEHVQTAEQFAEAMPIGVWKQYAPVVYLYQHPGRRIKVIAEHNHALSAQALERLDRLADLKLDEAELDAAQFAKDFVTRFCDYVSLRELEHLIAALMEEHTAWETRRQALLSSMRANQIK